VTLRSLLVAAAIACLIGAVFPYVLLKLGFGPNVSLLSTFVGFLALTGVGGARPSRLELLHAQTAGVAAGQVAFMSVVLAAFDLLAGKPALGFAIHPGPVALAAWLVSAGVLGALTSAPLRHHYIEEEDLPFAGGTAAGEMIVVLDGKGEAARRATGALVAGGVLSALVAWLRSGPWRPIPEVTPFGALGKMRVGMGWSLLAFGSGLLIGPRITLSMGLGMLAANVVLPPWLLSHGFISELSFGAALKWTMWPATGLMVSGGLTALLFDAGSIGRSFAALGVHRGDDAVGMSRRTLWLGALAASVALCAVGRVYLALPIWATAASVALALPLMLVGTRVLGETNWAPISQLATVAQAVLAAVAPGALLVNMVGSALCGAIPGSGEHLMQNMRAARIVGARPRDVLVVQLVGVVAGAIALAFVYPLLRARYGIGEGGLSSPISVKWAGFGELLAGGVGSLPRGSLRALAVSVALGVGFTVLEKRGPSRSPSTTGIGMGMLIPGAVVVPMVLGGLVAALWKQRAPKSEGEHRIALSSGLIAGEAVVAVVIPVLVWVGWMKR
jgi:uncharacterized oligopeptide transporter (OPT) family protein